MDVPPTFACVGNHIKGGNWRKTSALNLAVKSRTRNFHTAPTANTNIRSEEAKTFEDCEGRKYAGFPTNKHPTIYTPPVLAQHTPHPHSNRRVIFGNTALPRRCGVARCCGDKQSRVRQGFWRTSTLITPRKFSCREMLEFDWTRSRHVWNF